MNEVSRWGKWERPKSIFWDWEQSITTKGFLHREEHGQTLQKIAAPGIRCHSLPRSPSLFVSNAAVRTRPSPLNYILQTKETLPPAPPHYLSTLLKYLKGLFSSNCWPLKTNVFFLLSGSLHCCTISIFGIWIKPLTFVDVLELQRCIE